METAKNSMMREELEGIEIRFAQIGMPGRDGTTFRMPGVNPGETEEVREFAGVILYHHPMNFYFTEGYTGERRNPACRSYDGVNGDGTPGGDCRSCPLNRFGSGERGGKACRNRRQVYVLREGDRLPVALSLPTGSLKGFEEYVTRLVFSGKRPSEVMTRFWIENTQSGGPVYAQIRFGMERVLTEEERERGVQVWGGTAGTVDMETGEIIDE